MKNEIIIYQPKEVSTRIDVRVEDETVWLNRVQIALLFDRDVKTIGKHVNNVFSEGELDKSSTVAKFATVQNEGGRTIERQIEYYNLDVIISVGYRVKSKQGTQFRIWANKILKEYLLKGYSLNNRMNRIEDNVGKLSEKINEIDLDKYNTQYKTIAIKKFGKAHDRFLIVDNKELYHIGASLKDLGKKIFAFSKMDIDSFDLLKKLDV